MNNDIQRYKDMEKRVTLMQDKNWVKTIGDLKKFTYDDTKNFSVKYREEKQRKDRTFSFHSVDYVEENYTFIFTTFVTSFENSELTDEVRTRLVLKDIDIISFRDTDKPNLDDFFMFD
ncbi:hypothetical protein JNUCC23_09465 [Peribacillus sp. JNUCC 23]